MLLGRPTKQHDGESHIGRDFGFLPNPYPRPSEGNNSTYEFQNKYYDFGDKELDFNTYVKQPKELSVMNSSHQNLEDKPFNYHTYDTRFKQTKYSVSRLPETVYQEDYINNINKPEDFQPKRSIEEVARDFFNMYNQTTTSKEKTVKEQFDRLIKTAKQMGLYQEGDEKINPAVYQTVLQEREREQNGTESGFSTVFNPRARGSQGFSQQGRPLGGRPTQRQSTLFETLPVRRQRQLIQETPERPPTNYVSSGSASSGSASGSEFQTPQSQVRPSRFEELSQIQYREMDASAIKRTLKEGYGYTNSELKAVAGRNLSRMTDTQARNMFSKLLTQLKAKQR